MYKTLNINSEITTGIHKGKTVKEVLENGKKEIFSLIKQGFSFDDEVLSLAGIKKNVRDVTIKHVFIEHEKDNKIYEKETTSLSKILKEIRTIDNIDENEENNVNMPQNDSDEFEEINIDI